MTVMVILSALVGAVIGLATAGFGAAMVLVSALGHRDGGSDMSGFFGFGPIGGIAGALMGAGLALHFGGGSLKWGQRLMIAGGLLIVAGGILLAYAAAPDRGPSYSHVIEFELEFPAATLAAIEIPSSNAMWGAAGADLDDHPISQFFEKKCSADVCVVNGSVAALGPMNNFRIVTSIGGNKNRYALDLPAVPAAMEWSEWRQGDGARVRWRIVRH